MKKLLFTIVALLLPLVASANYSEKYSSNSWSHVGCDTTKYFVVGFGWSWLVGNAVGWLDAVGICKCQE